MIATVASWTYLRVRKSAAQAAALPAAAPDAAGLARFLPLLSFGTLITAALVPLATGLYLATTTAWTAVERAVLHRTPGEAAPAPGGVPSTK